MTTKNNGMYGLPFGWFPACDGSETPTRYRGDHFLYAYNPADHTHRYYWLERELLMTQAPWDILSNERQRAEAMAYMTFGMFNQSRATLSDLGFTGTFADQIYQGDPSSTYTNG